MTKICDIGRCYCVTASTTCDVTDSAGRTLVTAYAGQQAYFVASTAEITFSDDAASVVACY